MPINFFKEKTHICNNGDLSELENSDLHFRFNPESLLIKWYTFSLNVQ